MNVVERLRHITRRSLVRLGWIRTAVPAKVKEEHNEEIDFQVLEPVALEDGQPSPAAENCVCPVTRKPLEWGTKIYQCRKCKMSYSVEGWEFLRKVDGGRCCGSRCKKTVVSLR